MAGGGGAEADAQSVSSSNTTPKTNEFDVASSVVVGIDDALERLQSVDCNRLFGVFTFGDAIVSASDVMRDLQNVFAQRLTGGYGKSAYNILVAVNPIPLSPTGTASGATVQTTGIIYNGTSNIGLPQVTLTLNNAAGAFSSFVPGGTKDQTVTLLHELGHIMTALGGTQSWIGADGNDPVLSSTNTQRVEKECF